MTNNVPRIQNADTHVFSFNNKLINKTKQDFEIVVSRYDEDISWSNNYKNFRTIYNKGDSHNNYNYIALENKGHLADTILQHIIRNYDHLATTTFFTHGSFNYRKDQIIKEGKEECRKNFHNFITIDENAFIFIKQKNAPRFRDQYYKYEEPFFKVYKYFLNKNYEQKGFYWAAGKWMSLGKNIIHRRPKEFYEKMLTWVEFI